MSLLAIDPGTYESAYVLYNDGKPESFAIVPNDRMLRLVQIMSYDLLAVEMIASYGMPVGQETFTTVLWIGRLIQASNRPHVLIPRKAVTLHLCASARAKDANVRQALIDRYGPGKDAAIGRRATPGPLYGITSHVWSALAVAITASETPMAESRAA